MPERIILTHVGDGKPIVVPRKAYVWAKTVALNNAGLTVDEAHVEQQLTLILNGAEPGTEGLTITGEVIRDDEPRLRCDGCDPAFSECWNDPSKCRKCPGIRVDDADPRKPLNEAP